MDITTTDLALLAAGAAALVGMVRGWGREVVTSAILLGTVLALMVCGDALFAKASLSALSALRGLPFMPHDAASLATVAANTQRGLSLVALSVLTWVGYLLGRRHGTPPASHSQRLAGLVPGAINGLVLLFGVSRYWPAGMRFALQSPVDATSRQVLAVAIGAMLLILLVLLLRTAVSSARSSRANT